MGKSNRTSKGLKLSAIKEIALAVDSDNKVKIDAVCKKYKINYMQAMEINEQYMLEE